MKNMEIVVDSIDELKEVEKEILTTQINNKYKEIDVYCRDIRSSFFFKPMITESGKYMYFKCTDES